MSDVTHHAELERVARRLAAARAEQASALEAARVAAVKAVADGVPQSVVARQLNVNRLTVHNWFGKRESDEGRK